MLVWSFYSQVKMISGKRSIFAFELYYDNSGSSFVLQSRVLCAILFVELLNCTIEGYKFFK